MPLKYMLKNFTHLCNKQNLKWEYSDCLIIQTVWSGSTLFAIPSASFGHIYDTFWQTLG